MINGIINIYKEKGYTSHDVVAKARRILSEKKIGHTGTLDPEAEGVLPICVGKATKVVPYLTNADKCYEAQVILGAYTTTEDHTGDIVEQFEVNVTREEVEKVVKSFEGHYIQTPPMYSAIKINGVRLYELARKGIIVDRPQREVQLYQCELIEWITETSFKIRVACSKGTYIRTLCTDIGKKLGCGAYMGTLLRTKVGSYHLEDSVTLDFLENHKEDLVPYIHSFEAIFEHYLSVKIKDVAHKLLYNGNKLSMQDIAEGTENLQDGLIKVYTSEGIFAALYRVDKENQLLHVEKMFL